MKVNVVAEIGINHNGRVEVAEELIREAANMGCDYVKFQKRDPDLCVPEDQKSKPKKVPWREKETTYIQYKRDIEFDMTQYAHLQKVAQESNIGFFASVWDLTSAGDMSYITDIVKIPSAKLTDLNLLNFCRGAFTERILSTGMSVQSEIDTAIAALRPTVLMHTNSTYPTPDEELNLGYISFLQAKDIWGVHSVGYSNHSQRISPILAAVGMGCNWIEFHFTNDTSAWGSDQASSFDPDSAMQLVEEIRVIESAINSGCEPRTLYPGEVDKRNSLRG